MKRKLLISLLLIAAILCSLTSCVDGKQARADTEAFFALLSAGDYAAAGEYLHPASPYYNLPQYVSYLTQTEGLTLTNGITVVRYYGISSAAYTTEYNGSAYKMEMVVRIGNIQADAEVVVVENDRGYGIYEFEFDR